VLAGDETAIPRVAGRQALLAALAGEGITVTGGRSGMTCWVPSRTGTGSAPR
jgi:hypothetical protein